MEINLTGARFQVTLRGFGQSAGVATGLGPLPLAVSACHRTGGPRCPLICLLLCGEQGRRSSDYVWIKALYGWFIFEKFGEMIKKKKNTITGALHLAFRRGL